MGVEDVFSPPLRGVTMKMAITSTGQTLDAEVDQRFGRAELFLIVDTETGEAKAVDNRQNLDAPQGAGIQAAKTVIDQGAEVLITGHCGPNAFKTLQAAGIKVVVGAQGTVGQMLERFKKGQLEFAQGSDVPGHWS
jgi:predicted Fe-Mo cluster-binding NifX family protein